MQHEGRDPSIKLDYKKKLLVTVANAEEGLVHLFETVILRRRNGNVGTEPKGPRELGTGLPSEHKDHRCVKV